MRVGVISDTHGRLDWEIPVCDVFVHCGDMTAAGTVEEFVDVIAKMRVMLAAGIIRHALLVPGNHDRCVAEEVALCRSWSDGAGVRVLIDEGVEIEGVRFWGSPWTPPFRQWHFMRTEEELVETYKAMPKEVDVLITHGPPLGILDPGHDGSHAGSRALMRAVLLEQRTIGHHVFGHLHGGGGKSVTQPGRWIGHEGGRGAPRTQFHNVAAMDEGYNMKRGAVILEVQRCG